VTDFDTCCGYQALQRARSLLGEAERYAESGGWDTVAERLGFIDRIRAELDASKDGHWCLWAAGFFSWVEDPADRMPRDEGELMRMLREAYEAGARGERRRRDGK